MSNELQTQETLKERACIYHDRVKHLQEQLVYTFLDLGEAFSKIQKERLYEQLGYKNFNQYLHSPDVILARSKIYGLIRIYDVLIVQHGYSRDRIIRINWSKLYLLNAHLPEGDPDVLLSMAESNPKSKLKKELQRLKPKPFERAVFGEFINFSVLQHAPINEMGVVFLFAALCEKLDFKVDQIRAEFPDCIARRKVRNDKWETVRIEFEYMSKGFLTHGHDRTGCDLIICWEHNWEDCEIEVISLKEVLKDFALHRKY